MASKGGKKEKRMRENRCIDVLNRDSRFLQRFESPPVCSDFKLHDSNRKAKNRSNRW